MLSYLMSVKIIPALLVLGFGSVASAATDFAHEVLPILKEHCAKCHSNGKYKGSLSMDTREALLESESIAIGKSANSLFIQLLSETDPDDRMPQKADALPPEKIAILAKWVDEGLAWEPGFTFREKTWEAPLAPRKVELPPAKSAGENPLDRIARTYFQEKKISPPGTISDAVFLRRVSMDLLGILPSMDELLMFEKSDSPTKRSDKVAELLSRDIDFADHWMTFWNDHLRNEYAGTGFIDGGRKQITGWLYKSLRDNKPYDQFVRELMSPTAESEGFIKGIKWRGNVNASQVQDVQYAQNVSQVFFGENMKCASCHDSFINDWKLEDAYGMAAIIAGKPLEMFRCDKPTGEFMDAKFLFDSLGVIDKSASKQDRLKRAAELTTSKENGRLTRTIVNRLWARLLGRGLVEPVDIMGNRPWSEDMLDFLAWDLSENGFDLKRTLQLITTSRTYQSAAVAPPKEAEEYAFTGPVAKRMTAEQFIDAIWEITATAPGKIDAAVERGSASVSFPGKWIWSVEGSRPAGEVAVFTREFQLPNKYSADELIITCDNEYSLSVNGKRVGGDADWETVEHFDVSSLLRPGTNTIQVDGKNLGGGPNAAALFVHLAINTIVDQILITTDASWKANGKPAVELNSSPWHERVGPQIHALIPQRAISGEPSFRNVRASLVNSSMLMRALGRPNREQVVTSRPDSLTTLQALELNNGAEFVDYLKRGASKLGGEFAGRPDALIDHLYLTALSRAPEPSERAVGREILGPETSETSVADLLWTVLMLPEFQFVN